MRQLDGYVLAKGFEFPEGPSLDESGTLYVVSHESKTGRISKITPDGTGTTFVETGGKPNGTAFHRDGSLWVADAGTRSILRITPDGTIQTVVDSYEGQRINAPNDLTFDRQGNLYFTDPVRNPRPDLCLSPVYRFNVDGTLDKLVDGLGFPNGVALSPDETTLYVNETRRYQTSAFPILSDGSLGERLWSVKYEPEPGRPDGMAVDADGNLVVALIHGERMAVVSPEGKILDEFYAGGAGPTNVCFGGPKFKTLYITETETNTIYVVEYPRRGQPLFGDTWVG